MLVIRVFGVNYSFTLGLFIGIMTLLPQVGFLVSLVPVLVVTLATGHSLLSTTFLVGTLLLIEALQGNLLSPKLLGNRLNINTLSTFLGVFAGGLLWGVAGMFLGVLILGVLRISERDPRNGSLGKSACPARPQGEASTSHQATRIGFGLPRVFPTLDGSSFTNSLRISSPR